MNDTPLWLKLKPEYIDENFEEVLRYLQKQSRNINGQDSFYRTTVGMMEERARWQAAHFSENKFYNESSLSGDERSKDENLIFTVRLMAAWCLLYEGDDCLRRDFFVTMASCLSLMEPSYTEDLLATALKFVNGTLTVKMPFSWEDVIAFQPQPFIFKLVNGMPDSHSKAELWFEGKGSLHVKNGKWSLAPVNNEGLETRKDKLVTSFDCADGIVEVLTDKSEKLKQSQEQNVESIGTFTESFCKKQRVVLPSQPKKLKVYKRGDSVPLRVTAIRLGKIFVTTLEKDYEVMEGEIVFDDTFFFYTLKDFQLNLKKDDIIEATLVDEQRHEFSLKLNFIDFIVDERVHIGDQLLGFCFKEQVDKRNTKLLVWMTEMGYPVYTEAEDDIGRNDFGLLTVRKINGDRNNKFYGFINADLEELTEERFDSSKSRSEAIRSFVFEDEPESNVEEEGKQFLSEISIRETARMLISAQRSLEQPSERCKALSAARMMSVMIGDETNAEYVSFLSKYLESLVLFAKGDIEKIKSIPVSDELMDIKTVKERVGIVNILSIYGKPKCDETLSAIINHNEYDPLLVKIAKLVQSCNRITDVISPTMRNVIKREITRCLSVDTEGEANLEEESGVYLGLENSRQEFKTSFFHAPEDAEEQRQEVTIFKGVCAFLNTNEGGTLYLGVNDLGYAQGLENELKYMESRTSGYYKGIDGYMRYITDRAKLYFDLDVLMHIDIDAEFEGKVVAIKVKPYNRLKIVDVEGVPYVRLNAESVRMNEATRKKILDRRIAADDEEAGTIRSLMEAMDHRNVVILHGYSSSHSGQCRDRHVEPFGFDVVRKNVWCYDIEDGKNKLFGVSRIGNVEITDEKWTKDSYHKKSKTDIFYLNGDDSEHIMWELDRMAYNLITEEYPESRKCIRPIVGKDSWILETDICGVSGAGRFFVGLADHIVIVQGESLKKYVSEYFKKYSKM